ncbi:pectin lyase fold/virulence factor [Leptodontidium sp. MPI-SDFR-AT-0119]|nr:pectin lyase fold/virulence factor [Leptodontidium sp. MPI-SDFR-AT-0119]
MQLLSTLLCGVVASSAAVSAGWTSTDSKGRTPRSRPHSTPNPYSPGKSNPPSAPRTKTCFVNALGGGADDGPSILAAAKACNHGGKVALLDPLYTIGTALDLKFLDRVDIVIQGRVLFTPDITYWVNNSFKYAFQDSSTFWKIGGKDVNIYGGGTLDGNGQVWYDAFASDKTLKRPILLSLDGLNGGSVTGIKMVQSPNWFNIAIDSSNVIYSDLNISVKSNSTNDAKNTDGFDTYRSDTITIQNSVIFNGDDCVSFKPNSTNVVVQGLQCTGSHGISVGSLGQYPKEFDLVENVLVYNISMTDASDGARIKVWPGIDSDFQPGLSGGGGSGLVKNITYRDFRNKNNDYIIELTGCYGQKNLTLCAQFPSKVQMQDILFEKFTGTSSKKYDPIVGTLVCSSQASCKNVVARNINVSAPSGKPQKWTCNNIDKTLLAISCA